MDFQQISLVPEQWCESGSEEASFWPLLRGSSMSLNFSCRTHPIYTVKPKVGTPKSRVVAVRPCAALRVARATSRAFRVDSFTLSRHSSDAMRLRQHRRVPHEPQLRCRGRAEGQGGRWPRWPPDGSRGAARMRRRQLCKEAAGPHEVVKNRTLLYPVDSLF